jgi:hypothetical protein
MTKLQLFSLILSMHALTLFNVVAGERREPSPNHHRHHRINHISNQSRAVVPLPFNENFDSGLGLWSVYGIMAWNIPSNPASIHVLNPDIHPNLVILPEPPGEAFLPVPWSGNGMAWFGEASTGTFIGSDFNTITQDPLTGGTSTDTLWGQLDSPDIDLTMVSNARLTFWSAWEIEGVDADRYDLMDLYITTDGWDTYDWLGGINPLNDVDGEEWKPYSSGGLGQPMKWINHVFDLSAYVGNTVIVEFQFDTGDSFYNGFRGWFVDDVSITGDALAAPSITSITPSTSSSGEIVDVFGQNFVNGATIEVGGNVVFSSVFSAIQAEIEVPFLSPGQYDVKLTNPDGQFDTVVNGLTITSDAPPVADSIGPDSVMVGSSVFVTINGSNFQPGATATIGGFSLDNLTRVNDSTITGNSPLSLDAGVYSVIVTNPDGQFDQLPGAFTVYSTTGIEDNFQLNPADFILLQNYPNPFNPSTRIDFQIPNGSRTKVTVHNLAGQEVATLLNAFLPAGRHSINFNAKNLPSGVYFYRLTTENYNAIKKMILMK